DAPGAHRVPRPNARVLVLARSGAVTDARPSRPRSPRNQQGAVTPTSAGPLAGIRVLEVGHILAGPFGGMLLADLGADVIKIEPLTGDLCRQVGSRPVDDTTVSCGSLNRNKRSVHIDVTTADGQADLGALAA